MRAIAIDGACGPWSTPGHQRRLEQVRLAARRQFAAQHQPDHVRKAHASDQLLDRVAANRDLARMNVDDRRVPPGAAFGNQFLGCLRRHGGLVDGAGRRLQVVMRLDFGFQRRVVERAEELLVGGLVLLDRHRHPGGVQVVLEVHVLGDDVAAPRAAAQAGGHRHPVVERAGVGLRLRLPDHDPRHRRRQREAVDVVLVERVDAAGMALAADLVDAAHHRRAPGRSPGTCRRRAASSASRRRTGAPCRCRRRGR